MDIIKLTEELKKVINEISMERYLSVEPGSKSARTPGFELVLYEGNKKVPNKLNGNVYLFISLLHKPLLEWTDKEIIDIAKKYFDYITDDIRVVWY